MNGRNKELHITEEERLSMPALSLNGVNAKFGIGKKSFQMKDITFSLERGYILGLIGKNGAGKTSLLQLIMQNRTRKTGSICVAGYNCAKQPVEAKCAIGYVEEQYVFPVKCSVWKMIEYWKNYYSFFDEDKCRSLLKRLDVGTQKDVINLSKGEKIKVQLAFALSHKAELILMDEPTSGLDPLARETVLRILQEEIESETTAIVFSTHITEDIEKIADYVALMENGKMEFFKDKEELMEMLTDEKGERITIQKMMYLRSKGEQIG